MNPLKRASEMMLRNLVILEKLVPGSIAQQNAATPDRSDWVAVAACAVEEILDVHRWRNGLCRCGTKCPSEGVWRLHVAILSAQFIADDPRSLPTLATYTSR